MIIVTLTKNSDKTIKDTAESISRQNNNGDIIWYVVDDDSTDQTINIIKSYNINTKVIKGPNKGVFFAYNFIIEYLKEEKIDDIVFFLHSDDIIYDDYVLEDVQKIFNKFKIESLFANIAYFNNDASKIFRYWNSNFKKKQILIENKLYKLKEFMTKDLITGWMFPHNSFFFHSSILNKIPEYSLDYPVCSDYHWSLKILLNKKFEFYFYNRYIIKMRYGGMSTTYKNILRQQLYDFKVIKDFFYLKHKSYLLCILTFFGKKIRKIKQFF